MNEVISVRQGAEIVPIVPHVKKRHTALAARGIHVEHHSVGPVEFPERELQQHNVFLYTGPAVQAEIKSPEYSGVRWIHPHSLWVMPQGSRHAVRFNGCTQGIALAFNADRFSKMVEAAGGTQAAQIVESLARSTPRIEHLMRALDFESQQSTPADDLALECIATAIALSITKYAKPSAGPSSGGPGLSSRQLGAIEDYIEAHLSRSIRLENLASVAGLSSFHFLRAFKRSMGLTPARYVLDCRMRRAQALLANSALTANEVGLRVGFEHASHFTRAFRRIVGTAPSSFRRTC